MIQESGRMSVKRQSAGSGSGSGITFDLKSSPSSPAPSSLVPGHLRLVATVVAIIALTVLGLDWSNGVHRRFLPELQPPHLASDHW
jgi:hypothetical protein